MTSTHGNDHEKWFDDAHNLLAIAQGTPGLPLPSITGTVASFNYTGVTHAREAREAVATAETILSYAFRAEFISDPGAGSTGHYILEASLPSGLPLRIVARADCFGDAPSPEVPEVPVRDMAGYVAERVAAIYGAVRETQPERGAA